MLRKIGIILLISGSLMLPAFAEDEYVPGQMIVKFREGSVSIIESKEKSTFNIESNSIKILNEKYNVHKLTSAGGKGRKIHKKRTGKTIDLPDISNVVLVELSSSENIMQAVNDFQNDPNVIYASPNYIRKINATPDDPFYDESSSNNPNQWGLAKIGLKHTGSGVSGWEIELGSTAVKVAVIDTGINYNHVDLTRVNSLEGYDFVNNDEFALDDQGHGTHVAGIIGATSDNAIGVAGVDWSCRLIPIKSFDSNGNGSDFNIIKGIVWAVSQEADVINMSFGGTSDNPSIADVISYAATSDCVLVAAAGNSNTSVKSYPAAYDNVISVAAIRPNDVKASYSNFGNWVDVSAPGGDSTTINYILSTYPFNASGNPSNVSYAWLAGTSMAAPFVSGLAALIISRYPTLTAEAVAHKIIDYSENIDDYNTNYAGSLGKGRINAYASLGGLHGYISYPINSGINVGLITIKGNASGEGFNKYTVEYGIGTSPTSWVTIESSNVPVLQSALATIDVTGYDAYFTIKLTINDLPSTETKVIFHAGTFDPPLLTNKAQYGPNPFNPNKDQFLIKYSLTRNADVYIYFFDITGNLLCRKYYGMATEGGNQGDNRVYWDGKTDFGEVAANGVYLFKIFSEDRTIGSGKIIVLK